MVTAFQKHLGGCIEHGTISADIVLGIPGTYPRYSRFAVTSTGYAIQLPDARKLTLGGPQYILSHTGASTESIAIKDAGGTTVFTLANGRAVEVCLYGQDDADGDWAFHETIAG